MTERAGNDKNLFLYLYFTYNTIDMHDDIYMFNSTIIIVDIVIACFQYTIVHILNYYYYLINANPI